MPNRGRTLQAEQVKINDLIGKGKLTAYEAGEGQNKNNSPTAKQI